MSISLHTAIIGTHLQLLPALAGILDKTEAYCAENGMEPTSLTEASLAPDMWPFCKQVFEACRHSAGAVESLGVGWFSPDMTPAPTDFASLKQRVADAIAYLEGIDADYLDSIAGNDMNFKFGEKIIPFTVSDFMLSFSLPNFYFHTNAAYENLRVKGLEVGKLDYIGRFRTKR